MPKRRSRNPVDPEKFAQDLVGHLRRVVDQSAELNLKITKEIWAHCPYLCVEIKGINRIHIRAWQDTCGHSGYEFLEKISQHIDSALEPCDRHRAYVSKRQEEAERAHQDWLERNSFTDEVGSPSYSQQALDNAAKNS